MRYRYTLGATMRTTATVLLGALVVAWLGACGPRSSTLTSPSPAGVIVSGTWNGTGSDSFSPELVTWVVNQSGATLSGSAELKAVNPSDGTCGSCHKVKRGTFGGTLSGSTLSVSMKFPAGGDVPSPICVVDLDGTATILDRRMTGSYTGTDTCEGFFADGRIDLMRQ